MAFGSFDVNIKYENIALQKTDQIKLLGWTLDWNVKFTCHITNLIKNLTKSLPILNKFKKYPLHIRKTLFFALTDSYIKFSSPLLININKSGTDSIKCKYKKGLKLLNLLSYSINIKEFETNVNQSVCKFIYQILKHNSPLYTACFFNEHKSYRGKPIFLLPKKLRRSLAFDYNLLLCWNHSQTKFKYIFPS